MSTIYDRDGNVYELGISGTTNSENKLIIEQLNKFGRVPQTFELLQMIKQLEQENKKLKEILDKYENPKDMTLMMMWCTEKVKDENKQLKSNWNELKEIIRKKQDHYRYFKDNRYRTFLSELLDKMKELEQGSDNNVND